MSESQRRLTAILFSDIVGYSKMMGGDEQATFDLLQEHNAILLPLIEKRRGTVLKFIGDAILASFESASDAVRCAIDIQRALSERNKARHPKIVLRIGVHVGDVVERDGDIFGDGVNVAARIQPLAEPGGICVSSTVYGLMSAQPDVRMASLGMRALKNIKNEVEIYRVAVDGEDLGGGALARVVQSVRRRRTAAVSGAILLALVGAWTMRGRWAPALGLKTAARKDARFAVFVAPFHGGDAETSKDGAVMKTLVEERITQRLGPLHDIRLISDDSVSAPRSNDEAQAAGNRLGANLVIWGEVVSLGGETSIQPFLTTIGTSFREQDASALEAGAGAVGQLDLRKAKATELADLAVLSAAWHYGVADAEQGLNLIRTIDPPTAQSVAAEGYIRYVQKKWDESEALFKKVLTLDARSSSAYNGLGNIARVRGKNAEAEAFYLKSIALRPSLPNAHYNLARTYEIEGRNDRALTSFQNVIKLAPQDVAAHRSLGGLFEQLGRYDESAEEFRLSIKSGKQDADSAFGRLNYYLALMRSGREREAAQSVGALVGEIGLQACDQWPYDVACLYAGKYSEDGVLKAVEAAPSDVLEERRCQAYYYLGMSHLLLARQAGAAELGKARYYFQKCLKTGAHWRDEYRCAQAELSRLPKG